MGHKKSTITATTVTGLIFFDARQLGGRLLYDIKEKAKNRQKTLS